MLDFAKDALSSVGGLADFGSKILDTINNFDISDLGDWAKIASLIPGGQPVAAGLQAFDMLQSVASSVEAE